MVQLDIPAHMSCDEPGCEATDVVALCLLGMGTLAFRPKSTEWQVLLPPNNPAAAFQARCPEHKTKLQVGPAGPRIVSASER